jgi:hypothetical protein
VADRVARHGPVRAAITAAALRFSRPSNGDLRVATPGGEVRIEQHYLDPARRIERFELDDGTVIDAAALDALPIEATEGSAGDDRLTGSDFDDTLAGGAGRDELSGGPGADTYVCDGRRARRHRRRRSAAGASDGCSCGLHPTNFIERRRRH